MHHKTQKIDCSYWCCGKKNLAFPNNDLPGIYGAGAVQTLMNVYGVLPGKRMLMVGAGNIGVIVAYQLLQAGVDVAGIIEAAPKIGGYWVHAAKVQRASVPIYTSQYGETGPWTYLSGRCDYPAIR